MSVTVIKASNLANITGTGLSDNLQSVHMGLAEFGKEAGLHLPHRLVAYLAQLAHESMGFKHDREIWGPTAAQKRYQDHPYLGNTEPGDGPKFRGFTGVMITGRGNTGRYLQWCRRNVDRNCPNFLENPSLMITDPWEGIAPIWYWTVGNPAGENLNVHADHGDIKMTTYRINGGYNGLQDRYDWYTEIGLRFLGYASVSRFQSDTGLTVDGKSGKNTRAMIHRKLMQCPAVTFNDNPLTHPTTGSSSNWFLDLLKSIFPFLK